MGKKSQYVTSSYFKADLSVSFKNLLCENILFFLSTPLSLLFLDNIMILQF